MVKADAELNGEAREDNVGKREAENAGVMKHGSQVVWTSKASNRGIVKTRLKLMS